MAHVVVVSTEAETERLGHALAAAIEGPLVVALHGTLGAGKTRFVRAVAEGLGVAPHEVQSPTFGLIHEYHGTRTIYHFDAYRLRDEDEFDALGPDEYFRGDAVCLIEWAERVSGSLPRDRLKVGIEVTGPATRQFDFEAFGPRSQGVIGRLSRSK